VDLSKYKVTIPAGASGDWRIEHIVISELDSQFSRLRAVANEGRGYVPPGSYIRLMRNDTLVMSDTPDEVADHLTAIFRATRCCLVNGLGLGMVTDAILKQPSVEHVTVVDASEDVIKLVGPTLKARHGRRLTIVHGDAFGFPLLLQDRYGMVWHDIWDTISPDNVAEMTRLKRKYGRRADWQGCWAEDQCRWMKRMESVGMWGIRPRKPFSANPEVRRDFDQFTTILRQHMKMVQESRCEGSATQKVAQTSKTR